MNKRRLIQQTAGRETVSNNTPLLTDRV